MSTSAAGWQPDPTGRHEYRWWDGAAWSDVVADGGVEHQDPFGAPQPSAPSAVPTGGQAANVGYAAPGPASYPPAGGPAGPYPQQSGLPSNGYAPAPAPPASGPGGSGEGRSGLVTGLLVGLGVAIVALLVVLGAVVVNRDDGGDDDGGGGGDESAVTVDPRDALTTAADLPAGWTQSEVTYPPGPNHVCEPRLEPPTPPRASEVSFDRATPSGAITHRVVEYTPEFAADYVAEARRQAGECGTFETELQNDGETQRLTGTSELLTGPSFGDETLWYRIHVQYHDPAPSTHAVLVVLDRHGGVISGFTLSTTGQATTEADRAMVEELTSLAADRLTGQAEPGQPGPSQSGPGQSGPGLTQPS